MFGRSPARILTAFFLLKLFAGCASAPRTAACPEAAPAAASTSEIQGADPSGRAPVAEGEAARVEVLLKAFERHVLRHDRKRVLEALDPHYLQKEFEEYYKKDTAAFLNDFFCGWTLDSTQNICVPFDNVEELELTSLEFDRSLDRFSARYIVKAPPQTIRATLTSMPNRSVTFGMLGSRGFTQVE